VNTGTLQKIAKIMVAWLVIAGMCVTWLSQWQFRVDGIFWTERVWC